MSWWYKCTLFGMRFSHFFADFPCCFFWSKAWKGKPETNINLASITTFPTCHASETINFKGNTLHSSHIVGHVEAFEGQYLIFLMEFLELILQIKQSYPEMHVVSLVPGIHKYSSSISFCRVRAQLFLGRFWPILTRLMESSTRHLKKLIYLRKTLHHTYGGEVNKSLHGSE